MNVNELTMEYQIPNSGRKWWQLWKPRNLDRTMTIPNAKVTIDDKPTTDKCTLTYTLTADPTHIAKQIKKELYRVNIK